MKEKIKKIEKHTVTIILTILFSFILSVGLAIFGIVLPIVFGVSVTVACVLLLLSLFFWAIFVGVVLFTVIIWLIANKLSV